MASNKQNYQFYGRYSSAVSSATTLTGGITYEDPKFHLHLMHKTEPPSDRPIIHASKWQRLSYYGSFTSSADKTEIVARFIWFYALNTFFKSLPHCFVHIFLAAYAPEEHMFVTKMVPISIGLKYLFTLTGFVEILSSMETMMFLTYYAFLGVAFKNPWNRLQAHRIIVGWDLVVYVLLFWCISQLFTYEVTKSRFWKNRIIMWIYCKGISTLLETVCIYTLYPLGRLVDVYSFHYGQQLTMLRILSFRLVPVYYLVKLYLTIQALWNVLEMSGVGLEIWHYTWSWSIPIIIFSLGFMFVVYKYLVVYKMTWTYIFRPLPKWGPRDFSVQFDSRFYIGSQVPKLLSRYLMAKKDSKVYKIDVRYDVGMERRSTLGGSVRFGEEMKKKNT